MADTRTTDKREDKLVEVARSTADVYHFRSPPGPTAWWGGWAICTVNDTTGELLIQSDWTGACGHRWHVDHLGCPTLTEFLAQDRGGYYDYLVGKLLPAERRDRFSPEATVKEMRRRVIERRRDGGLNRDVARELWDALGELTGYDDVHDFFAHLCDDTEYGDLFDFGEDAREEPTSEATALTKIILPALVDACRRELARRALSDLATATPSPGQATRCSCTSEAGDSRCEVHPTCNECGEPTVAPRECCADHAGEARGAWREVTRG